jgi:hypothetical protein
MTVPCSLVEVDRRSRGAYFLQLIEAVRTSETFVDFHAIAERNIQEGCHLRTRRRENLKSHRYLDLGSRCSQYLIRLYFIRSGHQAALI